MRYFLVHLKNHFKILKNEDLQYYLGAQLLWQIGIWALNNTYALLVYNLTGNSALSLGILSLSMGLGVIYSNIFLSELPNKIAKVKILITLQLIQIFGIAYIAFMMFSGALGGLNSVSFGSSALTISTIVIYVMNFIVGALNGLHFTTNILFIKDIVGGGQFKKAIGINSIAVNGARFIGPGLAAFLISTLNYKYALIFIGLIFIPVWKILSDFKPEKKIEPVVVHVKSKFIQTLKLILIYYKTRTLFLISFAIAVCGFPLLKFAPAIAGGDAKNTGLLLSSLGAASLLCLIFVTPFTNRAKNIGKIVAVSGVWAFFWLVMLGFSRELLWQCFCFFSVGIGTTTVLVTVMSNISIILPEKYQAKTLGIFSILLFAVPPFVSTIIGYFIDKVGLYKTIEIVSMCGFISTLLVLFLSRSWVEPDKTS